MTVQEAIKKYKTGSILSGKNEKKAQAKIKSEEEVLWAGDFNMYTTVQGEGQPGTVVLTNERFFFCQDFMLGTYRNEKYFFLKDIIEVTFLVEGNVPYMRVRTLTDVMYICGKEKLLRPCIEMMEGLLKKGKEKPFDDGVHSEADELLKWKNLLDQGIITQAEFDAKKRQLLGL